MPLDKQLVWAKGRVPNHIRLHDGYHSAPVQFVAENGDLEELWIRKSSLVSRAEHNARRKDEKKLAFEVLTRDMSIREKEIVQGTLDDLLGVREHNAKRRKRA